MNNRVDLTIAMPIKNEEANLAICLSAIGSDFAKKVVIIDSGSTDRTKTIAGEHNVEVIDFNWNGQYPKKRNWYLQNFTPQTKWVMFLDADEHLTPEFKTELSRKLNSEDKDGYLLTYTNYFLGKPLKGGIPFRKLALFKVGALYEKVEEDHWSDMDIEVHEHPLIKENIGIINAKIDHRDFKNISHYIVKHNSYADWEARRFLKLYADNSKAEHLTLKQRLKFRLSKSILLGPMYFFVSFFIYGGFRDGARGLAYAVFKMTYFTQIYCKIKELKAMMQN